MSTIVIPAKSLVQFVRAVSGLFITANNPAGIPEKEITIAAALLHTMQGRKEVSTEDRIRVAELTNSKVQVITNYIGKMKKRGIIDATNHLHPIFFNTQITIKRDA